MTQPVKVLDAYAVMAFLEKEPGFKTVRELLLHAVRGELRLIISVVNLGEVYYSIARDTSHVIAEQTVDQLLTLPIEVVEVGWQIARQAAILKADNLIAFGDCFAAALGVLNDYPVVTGDPEFRRLEKRVQVEWI